MTTTSPGLGCSQGPAMRGMATIIMTATSPCTYDNHTTKSVRWATKMVGQMVVKSSLKHWKDMGVQTLTFYGYTKPNGNVVVRM